MKLVAVIPVWATSLLTRFNRGGSGYSAFLPRIVSQCMNSNDNVTPWDGTEDPLLTSILPRLAEQLIIGDMCAILRCA